MPKSIILLLSILIIACNKSVDKVAGEKGMETANAINDSIRQVYAPDKRVAVYDLSVEQDGDQLMIRGETDQPRAFRVLQQQLVEKGFRVSHEVSILPDSTVGDKLFAVVNNSAANIRSKGKHSAELATQAILGMGMKVLKIQGAFYLVQTPDQYISWVDHGGVQLMTEAEFNAWRSSQKIIFTRPVGYAYSGEAEPLGVVGDLVLGAQMRLLEEKRNHFKVAYPDGRVAFVRKNESERFDQWLEQLKPSGELLELYAGSLMGAPYLWGGTSSKGMDCSGFTKTLYLMNGMVIPRDASQQILAGKDIDPELNFSNLEKGDLLFFGKKATDSTRQRVTHVALWLGNDKGEFVHASGRVKMGSIDPESEYFDAFNKNRYLGSRRYLQVDDPLLMPLSPAEKILD